MKTATCDIDILRSVASRLTHVFEDADDTSRLSLARLIELRLRQPQAFVSIIGETSSGKSTIVNSLLSKPLLPVSVAPSTGTVVHVILHSEPTTQFYGIYSTATQGEITYEQFKALSLKPSEDLLRLQVRTAPAVDQHIGLQVFDTPGFNSMISGHEEVLRRFLPESDVVVFVVGYPTGFGVVEQDLLEIVGNSIATDQSIPVVVAINRTPSGCLPTDRRASEIMARASDCLKREPHCLLVESAPVSDSDENTSPVPNADGLWATVLHLVSQSESKDAVLAKLKWLLENLIKDALEECERKEYELDADDTDREQILSQIASLREARDLSRKAVRETIHGLEVKLPSILRNGCTNLEQECTGYIDTANKWVEWKQCAQMIHAHKLDFGGRGIAKAAETEILMDLKRLDERLEEIANTAVQKVRHDIHIKSDAGTKFTENLAVAIAQRAAGMGMKNILRGLGGVGGPAAGGGNLVKMVVSRGGALVGKTFPREVYNQIGKIFTKKLMARLNIAAMIIFEVGGLVIYAHRWQGSLKANVSKALGSWCDETIHDLLNEQIPAIEKRNFETVAAIYDDLIKAENTNAQAKRDSVEGLLTAIRAQKALLNSLARELSPVV